MRALRVALLIIAVALPGGLLLAPALLALLLKKRKRLQNPSPTNPST